MKYPYSYLDELNNTSLLKPLVEKYDLFFRSAEVIEPIKEGSTKNKLTTPVLAIYCLSKMSDNRTVRLTFDSEKFIGIRSRKPLSINTADLNHDWQILLQSINHTHILQ